jgi:polar amino acid transport system substrate-binding protein
MNKLDQFNLINSTFAQEGFAVGVRKDDEKLAEKINEGLAELRDNGEFKKISEKWFGKDVTID